MKEYEDRKYEAWKEQVEANLLIYLKKNLLTKPSASSATTHRSVADEGASSEDASGSLAAALQSQGEAQSHSFSKFSLPFVVQDAPFSVNHNQQPKFHLFFISASHPNLQYIADFAPELGLITMETKYLEQLGFQVPELARNVALQVHVCHGATKSVVTYPCCFVFIFDFIFTRRRSTLNMWMA